MDKVTTGTKFSILLNVAPFVSVASALSTGGLAFGLAATSGIYNISEITSSISQLIKVN